MKWKPSQSIFFSTPAINQEVGRHSWAQHGTSFISSSDWPLNYIQLDIDSLCYCDATTGSNLCISQFRCCVQQTPPEWREKTETPSHKSTLRLRCVFSCFTLMSGTATTHSHQLDAALKACMAALQLRVLLSKDKNHMIPVWCDL